MSGSILNDKRSPLLDIEDIAIGVFWLFIPKYLNLLHTCGALPGLTFVVIFIAEQYFVDTFITGYKSLPREAKVSYCYCPNSVL